MKWYVDVILPLPLDRLFTYSVPDTWVGKVARGMRLSVPFGRNQTYTAIVCKLHTTEPSGYEVKPFLSVLDTEPTLLENQMRLLDWIAGYYICPKGDVMKAMLPAALRPEGEGLSGGFRSHVENCVRLTFDYEEATLNSVLEGLRKAPRQAEALVVYIDISGLAENPTSEPGIVTRRALVSACGSASAVDSLISKGILEIWQNETGRLPAFDGSPFPPNRLNECQKRAFDTIRASFSEKDICLLYGITSSGKTEVYIHLMKECIESGGQVLFLLPEIALTLHIMQRLQRFFGNDMCVYHSRCSDAVRAEIWKRQLSPNPFKVIVGARSALFLPFRNLRLAVIDEEHDSSYKQENPAPRYNARNTALVLASFYGAKVLLGSATPSVETYHNALKGRYGLAQMNYRFMGFPLPDIEVVDVFELRRKKIMKGLFSPLLSGRIEEALSEGRQTILFRNRRGYSPVMSCTSCGWIPRCESCDVSLTWHRKLKRLVCHYCGKTYPLPQVCPKCGGNCFNTIGYGTEKVEEEIGKLFPSAATGRLDIDTASSPVAYERILRDFQDGVTDILIGTQMVTKGLDFDHVGVVGILDADSVMGAPDFRSSERAFQMLQQVAGRAGRRFGQGHVVVQTSQAGLPLYNMVVEGSYFDFFRQEIEERRMFNYPPFSRIVCVYLKSRDFAVVDNAAQWLGAQMRIVFGDRVLGPDAPVVQRVQMQFIRKLMLKMEYGAAVLPVRERLAALRDRLTAKYPKVTLYYDVDPM